ncbi:MAG: hypothetical protein AAGA64_03170 [Bacteroidota bacterium]
MALILSIAKSLEVPDELLEKYPDLIPPLDETIENQIESLVDQYLENKIQVKIIVKDRTQNPSQVRYQRNRSNGTE